MMDCDSSSNSIDIGRGRDGDLKRQFAGCCASISRTSQMRFAGYQVPDLITAG